jgi:predicted AAA+ superfamily ATPase
MINRNLTSKIIKALNNFRIVSINGPRQSGKTTLVKFIADQKAIDNKTVAAYIEILEAMYIINIWQYH